MLKYKYECDKCDTVATQLQVGIPKDWVSISINVNANGVSAAIPGKLICPECALKMGINPAEIKRVVNEADQLYNLIYDIGVGAVENSHQ